MLLPAVLYVAIVLSLIWGRLRFFRVQGATPLWLALSYDLAVAIQILVTVYGFVFVTQFTFFGLASAVGLYILALGLFWWSVRTAKGLDFAFSDSVGSIVTNGPYALVRHPFYVSYMAAWLGSAILFSSPILWITLLYLGAFYYLSARREEGVILRSSQAGQYLHYSRNVGMFLPRMKPWKKSPSEP